ncbi:MAG: PKD domain-containing protein [Candidatus Bathyarchaeota archaeon]|nr:PKD domain-containing protein [Candidatus Bathyarchaeota archaeon]
MKSYWWLSLFLLTLMVMSSSLSIVFCEESAYQAQDNSHHDDHLNDPSDGFPNDYTPLIIPIESGKRITVAPITTCTLLENATWNPYYHPCKMAQTILVDNDWNDGDANYTYIFEDWTDYDWNDIIVNLYASISDGILSDMFLAFREASWKNPFSLEITAEGTWINIKWNSTDYPNIHSLTIDEGETAEVDLFAESNPGDKAFVRFLIPPFASFSWYPTQPLTGETIVFDASASYDLDKEIETYSWSFGDDTSINTDNQTITHKFVSHGTYSVNLTVTDTDGLIDVVSKHIKVSAGIGGETTSLDNTLVTIWKKANILLITTLAAAATLIRRKKKHSTNLAE